MLTSQTVNACKSTCGGLLFTGTVNHYKGTCGGLLFTGTVNACKGTCVVLMRLISCTVICCYLLCSRESCPWNDTSGNTWLRVRNRHGCLDINNDNDQMIMMIGNIMMMIMVMGSLHKQTLMKKWHWWLGHKEAGSHKTTKPHTHTKKKQVDTISPKFAKKTELQDFYNHKYQWKKSQTAPNNKPFYTSLYW